MNRSYYSLLGAVTLVILLLTLSLTLAQDTPPTLTIHIPTGVNIRDLDVNASTLSGFPRGSATVIGWFNATAGDNFGRAAIGIWFVVKNNEQLGAVFSSVVTQTDSTDLTAEELAAADTPQYIIVNGAPTAPADPDAAVKDETTSSGDTSAGNTANPWDAMLDTITTRLSVFEPTRKTFVWEEVTIEVNHTDTLYGLPFGIIDTEEFPAIQAMVDRLAQAQDRNQGANSGPQWNTIPVKAILVRTLSEDNGWPNAYFTIPSEDGEWVSFEGAFFGDYFYMPLNDDLESIFPSDEWHLMDTNNFRTGNMPAGTNPVEVGDEIVVFLYNPDRNAATSISNLQLGACRNRTTEAAIAYITQGGVCTLTYSPEVESAPYVFIRGIASND